MGLNSSNELEKISVIIPVFNAAKYLGQCLESLAGQTYGHFEIILVDDASTDESAKICDSFVKRDKRTKVIHNIKNNGPAAARNLGLAESTGQFVFFADADDFLEKNALDLLMEKQREVGADLLVGNFSKLNGREGVLPGDIAFDSAGLLSKEEIITYAKNYLKKPNRFTLFAYCWGKLFKAAIIKNNNIFFDEDLRTFEDVAFNFSYLPYADKIFFLKETIYHHRLHPGYSSATMALGQNPEKLLGYKKALAKIGDFLLGAGCRDIQKEAAQADICLTIIQLIRMAGQINAGNRKKIYHFAVRIIKDPAFRNNLRFYTPSDGDSRILPLLAKLKLVGPLMFLAGHRARKRYGTN
jgi:glycosyltransferase involved in cell wall biosynthesis